MASAVNVRELTRGRSTALSSSRQLGGVLNKDTLAAIICTVDLWLRSVAPVGLLGKDIFDRNEERR